MSCCIKRGSVCVPKGDSKRILVSVKKNGVEHDISSATDIVFIVATGQDEGGGSMVSGGTDVITKRLGNGITRAGNDYQYSVQFDPADTADLPYQRYYFETAIIQSDGSKVSVLCGNFNAINTQIQVGP